MYHLATENITGGCRAGAEQEEPLRMWARPPTEAPARGLKGRVQRLWGTNPASLLRAWKDRGVTQGGRGENWPF